MITQAQIDALKTTLKAKFNEGLATQTLDWQKIATLIMSDGKSNTYAWLSQFPAFRKWVGDRLHKKVSETAYTVVNEKFENTLDVLRTDIEDDQFGHYGTIAASYGQSISDLQNQLMFEALKNGFSANCYDDQFFFDVDHPVYANEDGTGAVTAVSNMQAGSGSPWFLLCTKRAPKPFYLQERVKPEFETQTTAASMDVFNKDVYSFGGRWRGAAAYGFWQLAFGSKAELSAANFDDAFLRMSRFERDGRRKLGIVPDLLVCAPENRVAAENLLKAAILPNGATNTRYGRVELFVSAWI